MAPANGSSHRPRRERLIERDPLLLEKATHARARMTAGGWADFRNRVRRSPRMATMRFDFGTMYNRPPHARAFAYATRKAQPNTPGRAPFAY